MVNTFCCSFFACSEVCPVAEDFVGVVELALLPAHTLHTPLPEQDVPIHAGCAGGWGRWVAQEAPTPAQSEGTRVGGATALCVSIDYGRFTFVPGLDGVYIETVVVEISENSGDNWHSDCQ